MASGISRPVYGASVRTRNSEGQLEDWDISGESKNSGLCKNPGTLAGEAVHKTGHTQSGADERSPPKTGISDYGWRRVSLVNLLLTIPDLQTAVETAFKASRHGQ
jgi:hypothetical protein